MSMTNVNAKLYIARVLGGGSSQDNIDAAAEALARGYSDWQEKKYWRFLLKDTSNNTLVTGVTATASSAVVNAPSTGDTRAVRLRQRGGDRHHLLGDGDPGS